MSGYIYIYHIREFLTQNLPIYKIGRTKDKNKKKNGYPKGSKLLLCLEVNDMKFVETLLIQNLKKKCIHRTDLGSEYFEGNIKTIKNESIDLCMHEVIHKFLNHN